MDTNIYVLRARLLELFEYNREAGELRWKVSRGRVAAGQEAGRIQSNGYRYVGVYGKLYRVHRLIFLIEHGYLPEFLDHIDGDRLNNRIENLRPCSHSENNRNRARQSRNTSGVVGVCWDKAANKWKAQCRDRNGKNTHLGLFTEFQEAVEVVRAFRLEHHGQFACDLRVTA